MGFFSKWFSNKPKTQLLKDDWVLVLSDFGTNQDISYGGNVTLPPSIYNIYFSPSKEEYILQLDGYKPKTHPYYGVMMQRLAELNLERINKKLNASNKEER